MGIARGFTFGDGSRLKKGVGRLHVRRQGPALLPYFPRPRAFRHRRSGALVVHGLPAYFKELPPLDESPAYLYGWLSGYFAADGHVSRDTLLLDSADREHLEFVRVLCDRLGIGTYGIAHVERRGFASAGQPRRDVPPAVRRQRPQPGLLRRARTPRAIRELQPGVRAPALDDQAGAPARANG